MPEAAGQVQDVSVTRMNTTASINATAYYGSTFVPTISGGLTQLNVLDITNLYTAVSYWRLGRVEPGEMEIYQGGINATNDTPAGARLTRSRSP